MANRTYLMKGHKLLGGPLRFFHQQWEKRTGTTAERRPLQVDDSAAISLAVRK